MRKSFVSTTVAAILIFFCFALAGAASATGSIPSTEWTSQDPDPVHTEAPSSFPTGVDFVSEIDPPKTRAKLSSQVEIL